MAALNLSTQLWPSGKIPYIFHPDYPQDTRRQSIFAAMRMIERNCRVRFCPRQHEADFIEFTDNEALSNQSPEGYRSGGYTVNIKTDYHGLHELLHVIGLTHEQQRSDRDKYIDIFPENILDGLSNVNFALIRDSKNLTAYDRTSVTHYSGKWGMADADRLPPNARSMRWSADHRVELGPDSWTVLSDLDADAIRGLYHLVPGWTDSYSVPSFIASQVTPALAVSSNDHTIYMGWQGHENNELYYALTDDQGNWSNAFHVDATRMTGTPGMTALNNRLYVAWRDSGNQTGTLWYSSMDASGIWSARFRIPDCTARENPVLTTYRNFVYMAWVGQGTDRNIWYALTDGQGHWSTQLRLDGTQTATSPALAVYNNRLYIAWNGWDNDGIWYGSLDASGIWSGPQRICDYLTNKSPALGIKNGRLYAIWSNENGIWYADFDGTYWSGEARITDSTAWSRLSCCSIVASGYERLIITWLDTELKVWCADYTGLTTPTPVRPKTETQGK